MPEILPFRPSIPDQVVETTVLGYTLVLRARWNARVIREDSELGMWSMDAHEVDGTPIIVGIRLVLGVFLGRECLHPFFVDNRLFVLDTERLAIEPRLDTLGSRAFVVALTAEEAFIASTPTPTLTVP